jgi:hypothetical protein
MKCRFLILVLLCLSNSGFGQTFTGDIGQKYHSSLLIKPDSSVLFVYSYNDNCIYAEYEGRISKHTDTSYRLDLQLVFGQFFKRSPNPDSLRIQVDTPHVRLDRILISYTNGTYNQISLRDKSGFTRPGMVMPVNTMLFNNESGTDQLIFTINRKNPLNGRILEFKIPYGAYPSFTANRSLSFDVLLEEEEIRFVDEPLPNTSNMVMKCTRR